MNPLPISLCRGRSPAQLPPLPHLQETMLAWHHGGLQQPQLPPLSTPLSTLLSTCLLVPPLQLKQCLPLLQVKHPHQPPYRHPSQDKEHSLLPLSLIIQSLECHCHFLGALTLSNQSWSAPSLRLSWASTAVLFVNILAVITLTFKNT